MRIVAYLGVKDEVELIDRTIAHLRSIGVDHIIAIDDFSTDGTAERLDSYRSRDDFWFRQMNPTELHKSLELVRQAKADWAIFLDADEFWLPASGCLKDCRQLAMADFLAVDRFNVPLGPGGAQMPDHCTPDRYSDALFFDFLDPELDHFDSPWISIVPAPKMMFRPERVAAVTQGFHQVVAADNASLRRAVASDVVIAHLPFTSKSRFKRKVANIRTFMATHTTYFDPLMARHWRRWLAMDDVGRTDEEFEQQVLSREKMAEMLGRGAISSAAAILDRRLDGHVTPGFRL